MSNNHKENKMTFIDKTNMVMEIPATKKNVLEDLLKGFWMFAENRHILALLLSYVEDGSISVDVSNLQGKNWDATFRFKVNDLSAYGLMKLIGPMVTSCRPDELSMSSDGIVRMWWD